MARRKNSSPVREIFINSTMAETRIAILESNKLVELFVELPDNERMVGDIHLGRVVNVVKGMRAAFIDIGQKQDAFLHFSDIGENLAEYSAYIDLDSIVKDTSRRTKRPIPVEGQEILVQIIKEPISKKGSRITTEISIPGRFFVLVPNSDMIGVSKKVVSIAEKRRLKHLGRSICPKGFGLIIRTVAAGKDEVLLRQDLANLLKTWRQIEKKLKTLRPPSLVFKDVGMASSVIRDLFTNDIKRVVVDSQKQYKETVRYMREIAPQLANRVELYKEQRPLFDAYNIESEIEKSLSRKVWTRSGGYVLFDHTEALVAIDVNSGKFIGRGTHDENSLRINLEAGREIARQLRLRDIGGIIVIDFIDMIDPANRKKLYNEFSKELHSDRAQSSVSPISEFGLIEMTRERIRPSLIHTYSDPCPICHGTGRIYSKSTILTQIERSLGRLKAEGKERSIRIQVNPEVSTFLGTGLRSHIRRLMWRYWVKIEVEEDDSCALDEFNIFSKKTGKAIHI